MASDVSPRTSAQRLAAAAESAARELEETLGEPASADPARASAALARLRADLADDPLSGSRG